METDQKPIASQTKFLSQQRLKFTLRLCCWSEENTSNRSKFFSHKDYFIRSVPAFRSRGRSRCPVVRWLFFRESRRCGFRSIYHAWRIARIWVVLHGKISTNFHQECTFQSRDSTRRSLHRKLVGVECTFGTAAPPEESIDANVDYFFCPAADFLQCELCRIHKLPEPCMPPFLEWSPTQYFPPEVFHWRSKELWWKSFRDISCGFDNSSIDLMLAETWFLNPSW